MDQSVIIRRLPQPDATEYNMYAFIGAWMYNNGGTWNNARRVWEVELRENTNRLRFHK